MFGIHDYVVYKNEVCFIKEIRKNFVGEKDYYVLCPFSDTSLIINIPMDASLLKPVMSKQEAIDFISSIPSILPITETTQNMESQYKALLKTYEKSDLVRIIKTAYSRNIERLKSGKRIGEKDEDYFHKAETLLYNELSVSLGIGYDQIRQYVMHYL